MKSPVIIAVAITGSVPKKQDCPGLPITVSEQIEETHKAFEVGASLVHIHVRNADESSGSDPEKFAQVQEGVVKHCPGMIVQFSTGGRGRNQEERGAMLKYKPDMASLATGSVNFPTNVYENPPDFIESLAARMLEFDIKPEIEIFDLSMLHNAAQLVSRQLIKAPAHVQFVMGIPNAMPVRRSILEFLISELKDVMPEATWTAAGIGRHQLTLNNWALELGGHVRTGLEDNIRFDKSRVAKDNAELVARVANLCQEHRRLIASPIQARKILGLKSSNS
jgi:uncharacterized protein (DUF849 family)